MLLRKPAFAYRHDGAKHDAVPGTRGDGLYCEAVALEKLAARHGTPLYAYSAAMIRARVDAFASAFRSIPHTLCYSVKANSTLAILRLLADENTGFDVVSGGELQRVLRVNRKAAGKVVFFGRGQDCSRNGTCVALGNITFQRGERFRIKFAFRNRDPVEEASGGRGAGQSGCLCQDPSLYFDWAASA